MVLPCLDSKKKKKKKKKKEKKKQKTPNPISTRPEFPKICLLMLYSVFVSTEGGVAFHCALPTGTESFFAK